tara:strand:- start:20 stop:289 length:270 start_codon:yes stop_codon:yes gene_type:complete
MSSNKMIYRIDFNTSNVTRAEHFNEFDYDFERSIYFTKEMPLKHIEMFEKMGNIYICNTCRVTLQSVKTCGGVYKEAVENTKKYLEKEE